MSEIWRERKARREERRARAEAVAVFSLAENTWRGEIERLRSLLRHQEHREGRVSTHSMDCWAYGPSHYECAVDEVERLRDRLKKMASKARHFDELMADYEAERDENAWLREALREIAEDDENYHHRTQEYRQIARAALGEEK